jgi:hypothetical protein
LITTEQEQENKRQAVAIGFWSAILTAALNVWFYIAYALYQPIQHAPWLGLSAYAASFRPLPLLAWVVPCFLLAPIFLTTMTCLYVWSSVEKKIWSLLALVFAVVYTTLMSANYYIQMTVVQNNLLSRNTEDLSLWLYAFPYPRSIPGALEGTAYGFMCVSFLLAAKVFGTEKLQKWLRWTFVGTGITGLVVFIDPLIRIPLAFLMVDGVAGAIFLTLAPVLLAILFRRSTFPRTVQAALVA